MALLGAACSDTTAGLYYTSGYPSGTSGQALPASEIGDTVRLAMIAGARYGACVDRPTKTEGLDKLFDPWDQFALDHRRLFECIALAETCADVIEGCYGIDSGRQCTPDEAPRCDGDVTVNCIDFGAQGRLEVAFDCTSWGSAPFCVVDGEAARCSSQPAPCTSSTCQGQTLSYCYEGASMPFDCAGAGRECGQQAGTTGCVLAGGCSRSCSGTELTYCPTGGAFLGHTLDCASLGSAWDCSELAGFTAGCRAKQPTCSHGATRCVESRLGTCVLGAWVEVDCATFLDGTCLVGPTGARCEEGDGAPVGTECKDECAEVGLTCANEATLVECVAVGGCLRRTDSSCGDGRCFEGACIPKCQNDCHAGGATSCVGADVRTCAVDDTNCRRWGAPVDCPGDTTCLNGECVSCTDECETLGTRYCSDMDVLECTNNDVDPCTEVQRVTTCGVGRRCEAGDCVDDCVDECDAVGATECSAGFITTCGQHDGDTCLEWGPYEACAPSQLCLGSACACINVCATAGVAGCDGDEVAMCTPDEAGCLLVASTSACGPAEACVDGVCDDPPTVVISELGRHPLGSVIELRGPPGLSLHGWSLTLLDDASAIAEKFVPLMGTISDDGFWVASSQLPPVAHADLAAQNVGLSSSQRVILRQGTRVVDAVAYGNVESVNDGSGEGAPAPLLSMGKNLARNADGRDTGDNAQDFRLRSGSSFGAPNVAPNSAPTALLSCPSSVVVGTPTTLDASASYDFDDQVVSWTIAAGDGMVSAGPTVMHTYADLGTYVATVEVEDAEALAGVATCTVTVVSSSPPVVTWTEPTSDVVAAAGTSMTFAVDVVAAAGRTVIGVDLLVDGVKQGATDETAPYAFTLTLPDAGPVLSVSARALDDLGETGTSAVRTVTLAE
ncbi:MAG: PKD domain-containing protein [Myxococcales bacterium]|nr:PKD domain-containing protein [Myxococcales bacterium]